MDEGCGRFIQRLVELSADMAQAESELARWPLLGRRRNEEENRACVHYET